MDILCILASFDMVKSTHFVFVKLQFGCFIWETLEFAPIILLTHTETLLMTLNFESMIILTPLADL